MTYLPGEMCCKEECGFPYAHPPHPTWSMYRLIELLRNMLHCKDDEQLLEVLATGEVANLKLATAAPEPVQSRSEPVSHSDVQYIMEEMALPGQTVYVNQKSGMLKVKTSENPQLVVQKNWDGDKPLFTFPIGTHVKYPEGNCKIVVNGGMEECTLIGHDRIPGRDG